MKKHTHINHFTQLKLTKNFIFLPESQAKSPVEETKTPTSAVDGEATKAVVSAPNKVTAVAPSKVAPNQVERMDIDGQTTDSKEINSSNTKETSTKNVNDGVRTADSSKVDSQTTEAKSSDNIKPTANPTTHVLKDEVKTVVTPVKSNSATPTVKTPVTKSLTVSSNGSPQSVVTPARTTAAVGKTATKLVNIAPRPAASSIQVKNTPVQTVTLVTSSGIKSTSPLVKVVQNGIKAANSSGVTPVITKTVIKKELPLFKLGMEKSYEQYINQFSTNQLAKNKQQAQEERDRRRGISTKFNLAEYNYTGSMIGNLERILLTLRCSIVTLETSVPTAFMHPVWPFQRSTWVKAVHLCKTAPEFASVLTFFESFVKPVVMRNVWNDAVGHLEFFRNLTESKTTSTKKPVKDEEEELKNIELIGKLWPFMILCYFARC